MVTIQWDVKFVGYLKSLTHSGWFFSCPDENEYVLQGKVEPHPKENQKKRVNHQAPLCIK